MGIKQWILDTSMDIFVEFNNTYCSLGSRILMSILDNIEHFRKVENERTYGDLLGARVKVYFRV
jgi:hypothetical protein